MKKISYILLAVVFIAAVLLMMGNGTMIHLRKVIYNTMGETRIFGYDNANGTQHLYYVLCDKSDPPNCWNSNDPGNNY